MPCQLPVDSVVARFERQAKRAPERIALATAEHSITYGELNKQASVMAHGLRCHLPPGPHRILNLLRDTPSGIVTMLAVMKAGLTYVPLEADAPPARLAALRQEIRPSLILRDDVSEICPDQAPTAHGDEPAYILYTSGSTGQPKAIAQSHRNLLHFVEVYATALEVAAADRLSLLYSLSFSASMLDIFAALLRGACLHPYNIRREGMRDLPGWLLENRISVLHAVPTVFRHFAAGLTDETFPDVRAIDLGGESVYASDVALVHRHFPAHCKLWNHLAATEASVIAQNKIERQTLVPPGLVSVGLPAPGIKVTVVDEDGHPLPDGQPGELLIDSPYLSPSVASPYRSGDVVKLLPDGSILHVGRREGRFKVSGHTVEAAEIQAALASLPGVTAAAVAGCGEGGQTRIRAWVVGPAADYRTQLARRLPAYMLPARVERVERLPQTVTGKIDLQALLKLPPPQLEPGNEPGSPVEEILAGLWRELLGLDRVGLHDNFFELGGYSLLAFTLLARVEATFGRRLPLDALFTSPTLQMQAALLRGQPPLETSLVCLQPDGERVPLFLVHPLGGGVVVYRELAERLRCQRPVYAFQSRGLFTNPQHRVEAMAASYLQEALEIQPEGPYLFAGLSFGGLVAFEMARQLRKETGQEATVWLLDTFSPGCPKLPPIPVWTETHLWVQRLLFHLESLRSVGVSRWRDYLAQTRRRRSSRHRLPLAEKVKSQALQAVAAYRPGPYPGPVHLVRARYQSQPGHRELSAGWRRLCENLKVTVIPGLHGEVLVQSPYCLDALLRAWKELP